MKKYVVPLFLAACLLLTACGPKAPDTAEPSAPPSAAPETTDAPTPEPTPEPVPTPVPTPAPEPTPVPETPQSWYEEPDEPGTPDPEPTPEPSEENPHTGLDEMKININLDDLLFVLTLIFGFASIISLVTLRKREEALPAQKTAIASKKKEKQSSNSYHMRKAETSSRALRGISLKKKSHAKPWREQRT